MFGTAEIMPDARYIVGKMLVLGAVTCATVLISSIAIADDADVRSPRYYIGKGSVDLYTGKFIYENEDISIGEEGRARLPIVRYHGPTGILSYGRPSHSLYTNISRKKVINPLRPPSQPDYEYTVTIGVNSETFFKDWGSLLYENRSNSKSKFTGTSIDGPFIYNLPDGSIFSFGTLLTSNAKAILVSFADGRKISFNYETITTSGGSQYRRLKTGYTNFGYGVAFEYLTGQSIYEFNKICVVNLAVQYLAPTASCPVGSRNSTYSWDTSIPAIVGYTSPTGGTTSYTYQYPGDIVTIKNAGSAVNTVVNVYGTVDIYGQPAYKISSQTLGDGTSTSYTYQNTSSWYNAPGNEWTEVKDGANNTTRYGSFLTTCAKARTITDPLLRIFSTDFDVTKSCKAKYEIKPEGDRVDYTYDGRDDPIEVRRKAKPATGLADIVKTAIYPSTCTYALSCYKPSSTTDANGNVTDYTYDPTHGGVLTETGPAVNGVRPQKRYVYVERYPYIRNASNALVPGAMSAWLVSEERFCRATSTIGNACAGGSADEVVTTYDYGATGVANNLLVRGKVVTADGISLRTCYTYDADGNKISETSPRAGLTVCS